MNLVKTILTLTWVSVFQIASGQENLLDQSVSLHLERQSVAEALNLIMANTNVTINYLSSELPRERTVTKKYYNESLKVIIQEIWGSDDLSLLVEGQAIFIKDRRNASIRDKLGKLTGYVFDNEKTPLPGALVRLIDTDLGCITNKEGLFELSDIPEGIYILEISYVGYEKSQLSMNIKSGETKTFNRQLTPSTNVLEAVEVRGESFTKSISKKAIKINTIDAKAFQIQSVGAAEMLRTVPGVLVRRSGGLGSNASVNLNGLQGNAVRIYIDGFPVEYLGGGYNLNNLPGAVIDRMEVYKGVVPADKGTDALGGAVNIVSKRQYNDKLELSYQVGSFNTHRASFLGSKKIDDRFAVTVEGFHNYSDNDFLMGNVRNITVDSITDRFTGDLIPSIRVDTLDRVRRFHDAHRSSFVQVGLHWNDLSWADRLSFSSNFSNRFNEVQTLNISLGYALLGRTGEATAFNQGLTYTKAFLDKKLELKYKGVLSNSVQAIKNDNLNQINWNREIIPALRAISPIDSETEGLNHAHRLSFRYNINDRHKLSINNFYAKSRFFRKNNRNPFVETDNGELININELPSFFTKNIASMEWQGDWLNKKLTSVVFGKHYFYNAETVARFINGVTKVEVEDKTTGYGAALKYSFTDHFFIRGSYEYAIRIPTEREVYGDFENILSNFDLRPEQSNNVNVGITYEKKFDELFRVNTSLDGFIRDTKDLIWLLPTGAFLQYRNNRDVRSLGMEWNLKITRDDHSNIEFNLTSQERTYQAFNFESSTRQDPSFIGSRFPNTPSFFHNLQLNLGIKSLKSTLPNVVLYGSWFHIRSFSINDIPPNGEPEPFSLVPVQNEFNLGVGYFPPNDKLSLSFQVNNLTNDFGLFDNWRVPKPNRNFQFKVNYQIF